MRKKLGININNRGSGDYNKFDKLIIKTYQLNSITILSSTVLILLLNYLCILLLNNHHQCSSLFYSMTSKSVLLPDESFIQHPTP